MNDVTYHVLHCKEFIERLPNIKLLQKNFSKEINIFTGYYTRYQNLDKNEQINFLKSIDRHLKFDNNFIFYKSGQIGCYLSHHMIIREILFNSKRTGYSVIFEDDIASDAQMESNINDVINNLKDIDFDIVFLGNVNNNHDQYLKANIYTLDQNNYCWGAHALLINNVNIKKIFYNNRSIIHEIDNHYKKLIDTNVLKGYVVYPPICFQNYELPSNIKI